MAQEEKFTTKDIMDFIRVIVNNHLVPKALEKARLNMNTNIVKGVNVA